MRFFLLDRIDDIDAHRSVRARKLTSTAEHYWRDGGSGPQMPPTLVLEALCQAGTWLILESTGFERRAALLSVADVAFGAPVRPGDVLDIHGEVESFGADTAVLRGVVTVDGVEALRADGIMCVLLPADDLEDPEAVRRMHGALRRPAPVGRPS